MKEISSIVDDASLTQELNEVFDKIRKALNAPFTPNFFKVWAVSPVSLEGIWPVMDRILTDGKVSRKLKEMIFVAISSLKECHYCEAAHHAFCLSIGVTPEQIDSLIKSYTCETADAKEKMAIDYAVKLAKDSNSSSQEDFDALKQAGYSDEEVMEIIAMSGMAVFYNHLANATKINIDKGFLDKLAQSKEVA
ncbi:peroxidase-related enzyme [Fulvivirga sp. M361]|uniref:carboxymuconolactone decarboxylase family protein n=1 Tax=Fulvivirga sp. M361 TaxID=2594266 RepID=UPI001179A83C|nr:peroxidase-related enzyme [Fulvivirga sp. M361]TRX57769.1 peroxidase-related enzyme [Fulvivirga sp. M361]